MVLLVTIYKRLKDGVLKGLQTSEGTPCDFSEDENYTFEEISEEEYQNLLTTYFLTKTKVSKFEEESKKDNVDSKEKGFYDEAK